MRLAAQPAAAQDIDVSDLVVRLNRLEGQNRQLSGQVEQLSSTIGSSASSCASFRKTSSSG
jgi:hypothetical protein